MNSYLIPLNHPKYGKGGSEAGERGRGRHLLAEYSTCGEYTIFSICVKSVLLLHQDKALKGLSKPPLYGEGNNCY